MCKVGNGERCTSLLHRGFLFNGRSRFLSSVISSSFLLHNTDPPKYTEIQQDMVLGISVVEDLGRRDSRRADVV